MTINGPMMRSGRVATVEQAKAQFQKSWGLESLGEGRRIALGGPAEAPRPANNCVPVAPRLLRPIIGIPFGFPPLPDSGRQPPIQKQTEHKAARGHVEELRHKEADLGDRRSLMVRPRVMSR
jgi:hypothetical protein